MSTTGENKKEQELRIKVAELCGLRPTNPWTLANYFCWYDQDSKRVPDYPNDLNACVELLDKLRDNGWLVVIERKPKAYPRGGPWYVWARHGNDGGHTVLNDSNDKLARAICLTFMKTMEAK